MFNQHNPGPLPGSASGWNGTQNIDHWQIADDPQINYGPSSFNITQMLNGSLIYNLPVGRGRRFLDRGGILDAFIGGWQVSSIFQLHTGLPFTPVMGTANLSNSLAGNWYPNRVANGNLSNPSLAQWFDTSAFAQPATNTFGDSGRNILYGPGFANADLSLAKTFSIAERWKLQFRADAQDFLNHPNFGQPNANIGTAGAGTISSASTNRSIQLGAVLRF